MECAKQESKRKSALADFLKVKQVGIIFVVNKSDCVTMP